MLYSTLTSPGDEDADVFGGRDDIVLCIRYALSLLSLVNSLGLCWVLFICMPFGSRTVAGPP